MQTWPNLTAPIEYWVDAWQRSILFLDVLRERGNTYLERSVKEVQHVLHFKAEVVRDGRSLERPVNYVLVRIIPPDGTKPDLSKAPIIVVDPRAGHGPGIGGMKHDSQIGVALAAGHPCYFIGFLPKPIPGQTIEDVWRAEAIFVEDVAARHPEAEGKPMVIANCQAGWQIMMMAAVNPNRTGPIMLAGSPLSYWAGVHGKNPMRYLGGLLGGTWLAALSGDLGNGIFDGANLVANFESLNPANTYWTKDYNVYSKIDTEPARFLDFETWWGNPVLLNAEEMQWIADNLFVGNRLATGQIRTSDGVRIDLRNVTAPIIVFCSWGDNITPPQQALDWVLDLYDDEREIVENGTVFLNTYGSPWLQALVGLGAEALPHRVERDLFREASAARRRSDLEHRFEAGGPDEAALRALIYIRLPEGSIDERGFSVLKLIRASRPASKRWSLAQIKETVREQYLLVCLDEERAINALPRLLGSDMAERKSILDSLHRVLAARETLSGEAKRRLARVEALFDTRREPAGESEPAHA
jgi:hypothetical protein